MSKYRIDLEDFTEELFEELERINESCHGHELVTSGANKTDASMETCKRLIPFFKKHFTEYKEELEEI